MDEKYIFYQLNIRLHWFKIGGKYSSLGEEKFTFKTVKTDIQGVCTSTLFSPVDYETNDARQEESLDTVFISIFPKDNQMVIICGYHNSHTNQWINDYLNSWEDLSLTELQLKVSTILMKRCETWGMSPSLFNSLTGTKKQEILQEIFQDIMNFDQKMEAKINLFDN